MPRFRRHLKTCAELQRSKMRLDHQMHESWIMRLDHQIHGVFQSIGRSLVRTSLDTSLHRPRGYIRVIDAWVVTGFEYPSHCFICARGVYLHQADVCASWRHGLLRCVSIIQHCSRADGVMAHMGIISWHGSYRDDGVMAHMGIMTASGMEVRT